MTHSRRLAEELVNAPTGGIAALVQERVHSTTIGHDGTKQFLEQLIDELEGAIAEHLIGATELAHAHEVEIGSLLSASSLAVRYVTERAAMSSLLDRFRQAFRLTLRHFATDDTVMGLKMVALLGSTRVLEAFGDRVATTDVLDELQYLMALFGDVSTDVQERNVTYLFRPACDFINVVVQTHPDAHNMVYSQLLPQLLQLVSVFDTNEHVTGPVRAELLTLVAVLLDAKLPSKATNVLQLLPLPAFVLVDTDGDDGESKDIVDSDESADHDVVFQQFVDAIDGDLLAHAATVIASWMANTATRTAAATLLPLYCHARCLVAHRSGCDGSSEVMLATVNVFSSTVKSTELARVEDFEFFNVTVESIRDLAVRVATIDATSADVLYDTLKTVMPRLEAAAKAPTLAKAQAKIIKVTCTKIRATLVEAFVAWIHAAGPLSVATHYEDFILTVSAKLSDPRVYGDLVHVLRCSTATSNAFHASVDQAVSKLMRALQQLDRYSKDVASRIVSAVMRLAIGSGSEIRSSADDLATLLLDSLQEGHAKGGAARARINAVACLLMAGVDDGSDIESLHWVDDFFSLLFMGALSENLHSLVVLHGLMQHDQQICTRAARYCHDTAAVREYLTPFYVQVLSRWPLYEEDVEVVATELEILKTLAAADPNFTTEHVTDELKTVLQDLAQRATEDGIEEIMSICSDISAITTK